MKRALVIDDDYTVNFLIGRLLASEGFETSSAYSLKDTFELISKTSFDLIFMDNNLPDGLGVENIQLLKEINEQTVVIFMTALMDHELSREAQSRGADIFLEKPLSQEKIMEVLKQSSLST